VLLLVDIIALLSRGFMKLILIAFIIASQVAYYFHASMARILAPRINVSYWIFVGAGAGVVFLALLAIGLRAIKARLPIQSTAFALSSRAIEKNC
jgi:putative ABC transport system permease protein